MAVSLTGVISGCAVSPGGAMTLKVAAGVAAFDSRVMAVKPQTLMLAASDATDRYDVVDLDSDGVARIVPGQGTSWTPATSGIPLATFHVVGGITTILARHIVDRRDVDQGGPS